MTAGNKTQDLLSGLKQNISPVGAWALAFGCSVGWGSFVMPGTTFLPIAGPLGTAAGMLIGAFIMLIIGINYHYMMNIHPDCGGIFTYVKKEMGFDEGFLSTWFLVLVYIAIMWANATAIPLICRNVFPGLFEFGFHYEIAGFSVYFGEIAISLTAIVAAAVICILGGKVSVRLQIVFAIILIGGILTCTAVVFLGHGIQPDRLKPLFAPKNQKHLQIFQIIALAPWAYVGFESISHSTEEFTFSTKKTIIIFVAALITGALAYSLLPFVAVSVLPEGYADWTSYLNDLGNRSGISGLPVYHAIYTFMGSRGRVIFALMTISAVMTGLIGNLIAASRLLYSMAREQMLPGHFLKLNRAGAPKNIILCIMGISLFIPFWGRTAIGWIVDVNTIGATIAYAYISGVSFKKAHKEKRRSIQVTGITGLIISLLFTIYFLVPNIWSAGVMAPESYFILIVWSILGFFYFRYVLKKDVNERFGKSTVVWIVLLFLIFFVTMLWYREATKKKTKLVLENLNQYNVNEMAEHGIELSETENLDARYYLQKQIDQVDHAMQKNSIIQLIVIMIALFVMFNIYHMMSRKNEEAEIKKVMAEAQSKAKGDFLSSMSHDMRTPMNAIMGYTVLAKKEKDLPPAEKEYLDKIEISSRHLLTLINDVLDMGRIESGKMELEMVRTNLLKVMDDVKDMFATQMEGKNIRYTLSSDKILNQWVICDANRLNRILLNLISNAYKFTPSGGSVQVQLKQTGSEDQAGLYELRVKDSGMGMSPEFAKKVFDAYEREQTAVNIQGTGLGMTITKNMIDLMGGSIRVETEQGKGTEFIINVSFLFAPEPEEKGLSDVAENAEKKVLDYSRFKLLLVEDQQINLDLALMILEEYGFQIDTAQNGKEALDKVTAAAPGEYSVILMDVQMPLMNGYEATQAIRKLKDKKKASVPVVAMTGNAFSEDIQRAKDAGMDNYVTKPIDFDRLMEVITEFLYKE